MQTPNAVAEDIIKIIYDIYYGQDKEAIQFRVRQGANGAVDKIIRTIREKYGVEPKSNAYPLDKSEKYAIITLDTIQN